MTCFAKAFVLIGFMAGGVYLCCHDFPCLGVVLGANFNVGKKDET